ncbi:MAG: hypothetical protein IIV56_06975, partial [Mailhella sp.]|nr:hypothetical protein [Mailhella sp.]
CILKYSETAVALLWAAAVLFSFSCRSGEISSVFSSNIKKYPLRSRTRPDSKNFSEWGPALTHICLFGFSAK